MRMLTRMYHNRAECNVPIQSSLNKEQPYDSLISFSWRRSKNVYTTTVVAVLRRWQLEKNLQYLYFSSERVILLKSTSNIIDYWRINLLELKWTSYRYISGHPRNRQKSRAEQRKIVIQILLLGGKLEDTSRLGHMSTWMCCGPAEIKRALPADWGGS